jgi:hypothetical protein
MSTLHDALQGAMRPASPAATAAKVGPALVLGAGGWLGAAMLAQVLSGGFQQVGAWVRQPMASTHRGLVAVDDALLATPSESQRATWAGSTAFVVLERPGLVGARDRVFVSPPAADLLALARQLRALGVARLLVVLPHAANSLPEALRHGFANEDEQALSTLGFDQVVLVRSSREAAALPDGTPWWDRLAAAWWAQLRWIIPDAERPLRSVALARVVAAAERLLREAPQGVWVLPQQVASRAAHAREGVEAVLRTWVGADSLLD